MKNCSSTSSFPILVVTPRLYLYFRRFGAAETLLHLHLKVAVELAAVQQGEPRPRFQSVFTPGVHGGVALVLRRGRGGKHHVQVY